MYVYILVIKWPALSLTYFIFIMGLLGGGHLVLGPHTMIFRGYFRFCTQKPFPAVLILGLNSDQPIMRQTPYPLSYYPIP